MNRSRLFKERLEQEETYQREKDKFDVVLPPEIDTSIVGLQSPVNWAYDFLEIEKLRGAWANEITRKVGICIIDTAWKVTHKDLLPFAVNNESKDFTGEEHPSGDGHGHGTHCAGTSTGQPGIGIGPSAEGFLDVRVIGGLNSAGSGRFPWLKASFRYAIDLYKNKYKALGYGWIISNSWGGGSSDPEFAAMIKEAKELGIIVTASAGNSGYRENQSTVLFPGKDPNTIAIGAIGQNRLPANFSSAGPELNLTGPGVGIVAHYKDNSYRGMSGTSMSNPIIAGLSAWMLSRFPEIKNQEQLYSYLKAYSTDLLNKGFDVRTGWGLPEPKNYLGKTPGNEPDEPDQPDEPGDEPDNPKKFPNRALTFPIEGVYSFAWTELNQGTEIKSSGLISTTGQPFLIDLESPRVSNLRQNQAKLTDLVVRTQSTEEAEKLYLLIEEVLGAYWLRRGVAHRYPMDFELAGQVALFFTEMTLRVDHGIKATLKATVETPDGAKARVTAYQR